METTIGTIPIVRVLFALYPGMDALNVLGPLEVLNKAFHNLSDPCKYSIHVPFLMHLRVLTISFSL